MSAKERPQVDVDEDMLRNAMLDVPAMRNRPFTYAPPPKNEPEPPKLTEPEAPKRGPHKKKEGQYAERFLVNDNACSRVTTAIDRDIHRKMRRVLSMVAPEVTIVSYISNVLTHHLDHFEEEINALYRTETEKPL